MHFIKLLSPIFPPSPFSPSPLSACFCYYPPIILHKRSCSLHSTRCNPDTSFLVIHKSLDYVWTTQLLSGYISFWTKVMINQTTIWWRLYLHTFPFFHSAGNQTHSLVQVRQELYRTPQPQPSHILFQADFILSLCNLESVLVLRDSHSPCVSHTETNSFLASLPLVPLLI